MLKTMLASAMFAGLAAGVLASALHFAMLVPVIVEAEEYESGNRVHFTAAPDAPAAQPAEATEQSSLWNRDANPWHRAIMTFGAELVTYTGFALILTALFTLAQRFGHNVSTREAVLWGLAAFLALHVAPAAVLPPETPGIPTSDVAFRQFWWAGTVLATGAGLAMCAFSKGWPLLLAGVALIMLPQLVNAPHPPHYAGVVPPLLEGLFVGRSIAAGAMTWAALGLFCGYFRNRFTAATPG